jgi:hypothetical protein
MWYKSIWQVFTTNKIANKHIIGLSKLRQTLNTLKDANNANQTQKKPQYHITTPSLPWKSPAPHVFQTFALLKIYTL